MAREFDLMHYRELMESAVGACKGDFSGLRTGRASSSLVDHLPVNVYGSRLPLNQLATVSVPESRLLCIQVWDRSQVDAVTRAIHNADLGLSPRVEGATIHLPLPALSQERRQELVRIAHKYAEQARVAVRHARREAMDKLKKMEKNSEMSQDERDAWMEEVTKLCEKAIRMIDDALSGKEVEIMQV